MATANVRRWGMSIPEAGLGPSAGDDRAAYRQTHEKLIEHHESSA
jgi:hypothetical protein